MLRTVWTITMTFFATTAASSTFFLVSDSTYLCTAEQICTPNGMCEDTEPQIVRFHIPGRIITSVTENSKKTKIPAEVSAMNAESAGSNRAVTMRRLISDMGVNAIWRNASRKERKDGWFLRELYGKPTHLYHLRRNKTQYQALTSPKKRQITVYGCEYIE